MAAACRAAGLKDRGAKLIRFGENGLFRLASTPVIVRVARREEWCSREPPGEHSRFRPACP